MKTKLLLLFVIIFNFAASCEPEPIQEEVCNCEKVFYDYGVVGFDGATPWWDYTETGRQTVECQEESDAYVLIGGNKYYAIECE
jgi:hypothetical protein